MSPSKSKRKGNSYETEISKLLTRWWGSQFRRIPNSGALRWKDSIWTYGDLLVPEDFKGLIECKHHHEVDLSEVLRKGLDKGKITKWWFKQACVDAIRARNEMKISIEPFLIWKRDYTPSLFCMRNTFFRQLPRRNQILHMSVSFPRVEEDMIIVDLKKMLKVWTKAEFKAAFAVVSCHIRPSPHSGIPHVVPRTSPPTLP
jgi:hypothetical protein